MMDTLTRMTVETVKDGYVIRKGRKRTKPISYEQMFELGYSMFQDGKPKAAEDIFKQLATVRGRGARAKMMLARCKAELDKYDECEKIIKSLFDEDDGPVANELQTAFVYHSIGMTKDAIQEMVKIVNEYPDLPTACLYLGDLFNEGGDIEMAVKCWKLAVNRDRKGGSVAKTAKRQLDRIVKHVKQRSISNKKLEASRKRRTNKNSNASTKS